MTPADMLEAESAPVVDHSAKYTEAPICPHCGHRQRDAWEWELGGGYEGEGDAMCGSCGEEFGCSRHVEVTYSTTKKTCAEAERDRLERMATNSKRGA